MAYVSIWFFISKWKIDIQEFSSIIDILHCFFNKVFLMEAYVNILSIVLIFTLELPIIVNPINTSFHLYIPTLIAIRSCLISPPEKYMKISWISWIISKLSIKFKNYKIICKFYYIWVYNRSSFYTCILLKSHTEFCKNHLG